MVAERCHVNDRLRLGVGDREQTACMPNSATFAHVVIDCADPVRLASFWSAMLGAPVHARWKQYVMLEPTLEGGPAFAFQKVAEAKAGKNRVHVDLTVDDLEAETARAAGLGATFIEEHSEPNAVTARVMADPEGNEFCLVKLHT